MNAQDLLMDGFGRMPKLVQAAVEGLSEAQLSARPAPSVNSIAWLVWHIGRVEDAQISQVAETEQAWIAERWVSKFHLPFDVGATGYGQSSDEVSQVRNLTGELLVAYYDAVHDHTMDYLESLEETDLDRVVDERFSPPVTAGVRLMSVLADVLEHAGQAAILRPLITA